MLQGRDLSLAHRGKGLQAAYPGTTQAIAFTETATASAAVGSGTYMVRLCATADCHVVFATTPTATTASMLLPADTPEYFLIDSGAKVGVVEEDQNGGTLFITECK